MANLVQPLSELRKERAKVKADLEAKLKGYDIAIAALEALNDTCEKCGGSGKVLRSRACAEDDRPDPNNPNDWVTCAVCGGTGKVAHKRNFTVADTAPHVETVRRFLDGGETIGDFQFR